MKVTSRANIKLAGKLNEIVVIRAIREAMSHDDHPAVKRLLQHKGQDCEMGVNTLAIDAAKAPH
eukprot:11310258-Heterocapsa_arctica.AAC.1